MTEYARARAAVKKPPPAPEPVKARTQMKRTPLKRVSKKRAKLMRTLSPVRRELKKTIGQCMRCLDPLPPDYLDVHEIASGAAREKCLSEPSLQLVLCRECHEDVQSWPPAKQIALRHQWLIEEACEKYCELNGLADTAVVAAEVFVFLMYQKPPSPPSA
jgi:hypothetical protein